ncbi:hypothetical protein F4781DRAFT_383820 [Annulohypoxylon bovei var. microspora]|nr:hypothetical protein F4781DRAFT_383820 [Annulohypoxylon bovei var. microspora]
MESSESTANASGLLALPRDILVMLPEYLHNIEDYMNVASTSRLLRSCMEAARPHTILCLSWASTRTFFRPSPYFLFSATAAQVGAWARESDANEAELAAGMPIGVGHVMDLALRLGQIGLTMERIRELHEMRFSVMNPISDLMDKCVGKQWYSTPDFWNGGVDDAYTIHADANELLFRLAAYGEMFGPDFEPFLDPDLSSGRKLKVETRLEFVKYCIPDFATECFDNATDILLPDGSYDPRRAIVILKDGPYGTDEQGRKANRYNNNLALYWVVKSTRWRPHWIKARQDAGASPDFATELESSDGQATSWKQNMLETVMQCQGMEALGMIRTGTEIAERYKPKIKEWREEIERLEVEPQKIVVGICETHEYPDLWGDLRICASGYVLGT